MSKSNSRRISRRLEIGPDGRLNETEPPDNTRIIVIGHKNPDTDSIAAATVYAELKRALGVKNVSSACAGLPSSRTQCLFRKFSVPLPLILMDVYPRLKDVINPSPVTISAGHTLIEALTLLQKTKLRRLPVVGAQGDYMGMVSLFDLADRMIRQAWEDGDEAGGGEGLVGREVQTSIAHISEVLKGSALSLHRENERELYEVYVAAMSETSLRKRMSTRNPENLVLIVGDRHDIHQMAVDLKLRLVIVTGNFEISPDLTARARAQGTSILQTPFDSATTVRRLKFSAPAELMLQEDTVTFNPDEKLSEVKDWITGNLEDTFPVVDNNGKLVGVFNKGDLDGDLPVKLILVDHNEMDQAVDGADELPIIEILDHHRLGSHSTQTPIVFINDVVGSTCTLVAEQFRRFGLTPTPQMAGIMMGGIITDTVLLRSPTATSRDRIALDWLQSIAQVEPKALADEILAAGSTIATQSPRQVLTADKKPYKTEKCKFAVSQVEEVGFENFFQHRSELLAEMRRIQEEDELDFFGLLVTNVVRETSMMLCVGDKRLLDMLNYNRLDEHTFDLPGVMSRKKQLLPHLLKVMS